MGAFPETDSAVGESPYRLSFCRRLVTALRNKDGSFAEAGVRGISDDTGT